MNMNRVVLFLSCLLLLIDSSAIAADITQNKKKPVNAPAPLAKKVAKSWEPTAFIKDGERLPVDYAGLDPKKFLDMFRSKLQSVKKGEFETAEEFSQRTANKDALLAPINTSDLYAFRILYIHMKYDADAQAYTVGGSFGYSCDQIWDATNLVACKVASAGREEDRYTGSNAYGVSLTVSRTRGHDLALAIPKASPLAVATLSQSRYRYTKYDYQYKLSVPLEKARDLKGKQIAVLFVGRVSDAKILRGSMIVSQPKIDSPVDTLIDEDAVPFDVKQIIYYVLETGEILDEKVL